MSVHKNTSGDKAGVWYALAAFALWGVLPLYWKALARVPAAEILAHRVIWSLVFVAMLLVATKRWNALKQVAGDGKKRVSLLVSALLVGLNWFIYIWAVNAGHILEASMGYFITPLLNVLLGLVFLREKLNTRQAVALGLAAAGVLLRTIELGNIPWISLSLAVSFAGYGFVKKTANLDGVIGLLAETAVLAPIAVCYVAFRQIGGSGALGASTLAVTLLLLGAGVVTSTPMILFAEGARRVTLSTLGFVQYVLPSISLLLGVLVYHEPLTRVQALSFVLIWCALVLYSLANVRIERKPQAESLGGM